MALLAALETESSQLLVDSKIQSADVVNIRLLKAQSNLNKALELYSEADLLDIQDRLLSIEFNVVSRQDESENQHGAKAVPHKLEDEPPILDELNMLTSEMQLRHRKVDKMEVNSYQQDQLSGELADMAKTIKRNAELFQQKLDTDSDLVSTTTDAITRTAGSMSNVGQRLSQYRRETQLGWMFYIWSALFILLSLIFGMALIQLFGKW